MAKAVFLWSPVIITGVIPANLHFITESLTSGLGGSIIPAIPRNISSFSRLSLLVKLSTLYAPPIHLSALLLIFSTTFNICCFF